MAVFPSDSIRTKNWGTEILTDADLEAQLDLLHAYFQAALNSSTGHAHTGTSNQGPLITTLGTLTTILKEDKGADVASAAGNIVLGDDGNFFDITGVAAITSITIKPLGTMVTLQFDSTASLVDGGNLKIAGNFQGAAEATITLRSDGTNWFEVARNIPFTPSVTNALSGSVIQMVNQLVVANTACATDIPVDNSARTSSEGNQVLTKAITPNNASNLLRIDIVVHLGAASACNGCIILMNGTTVLATGRATIVATKPESIALTYWMTAGGTSAITFNVNAGADGPAATLNGAAGASLDAGKVTSSITITEIKA